ncbi:MAG: GerMN domain-containing protein [Lachnospiraceae bacterium]|nr:GerMN domain-containing protein [Candidatus Minthocola equi]
MKKIFSILLILALMISGCSGSESNEGAYTLYYTNSARTKLLSATGDVSGTGVEELAGRLFGLLANPEKEGFVSPIPPELAYKSSHLDGDVLNLYFDGSIESATPAQRILFAAAVTKTLTQFDEIGGVVIYVGDEMMRDGTDRVMGIMRSPIFVNNAADDPDDYRSTDLKLYFTNETGDRLVESDQTITSRSSTLMERVIVEAVIAGPSVKGLYPVVSPSVTLLSINTRDGICYVNLDSKFVNETVTAYDTVPVYAIVNALSQLDTINAVQISINGATDITMPMGQISFETPFTFNDEIILK